MITKEYHKKMVKKQKEIENNGHNHIKTSVLNWTVCLICGKDLQNENEVNN